MSAREAPSKWRKSSFSQNGDCVEVSYDKEHVYVRDSKSSSEVVLTFAHSEWRAFIIGVKSGEVGLNAEEHDQISSNELLKAITDWRLHHVATQPNEKRLGNRRARERCL